MKKCPFCAEEIQDEAIKCKHCGEFLNQSTTQDSTQENTKQDNGTLFYLTRRHGQGMGQWKASRETLEQWLQQGKIRPFDYVWDPETQKEVYAKYFWPNHFKRKKISIGAILIVPLSFLTIILVVAAITGLRHTGKKALSPKVKKQVIAQTLEPKPLPAKTKQTTNTKSEYDYILECEQLIKANARFPSSVDAHTILGSDVKEFQGGKIGVLLEFDAKNGLGNELPYKAICTKENQKTPMQISIYER